MPTDVALTLADYLALVEWTGQQIRPGKRGTLSVQAPSTLAKFEVRPERWALRVKRSDRAISGSSARLTCITLTSPDARIAGNTGVSTGMDSQPVFQRKY
jgi:hypothetical protein